MTFHSEATIPAIAGPITEAMYGIPEAFKKQAESRYLASAQKMLEVL